MSDQQKPAPCLRWDVEALIRGMKGAQLAGLQMHNIAAVHFDGPVLNQMVDVFVRFNSRDLISIIPGSHTR